jgi:hypothetical protein
MADIFSSHSKSDRDHALKLSAFLEAEGWSLWWDKGLNAADAYRDVIMRELTAARAVISIWTETSIKSDWVRASRTRQGRRQAHSRQDGKPDLRRHSVAVRRDAHGEHQRDRYHPGGPRRAAG